MHAVTLDYHMKSRVTVAIEGVPKRKPFALPIGYARETGQGRRCSLIRLGGAFVLFLLHHPNPLRGLHDAFAVLLHGPSGRVLGEPSVDGRRLHVCVVQDLSNQRETLAGRGEPAPDRAPQIVQPRVEESLG